MGLFDVSLSDFDPTTDDGLLNIATGGLHGATKDPLSQAGQFIEGTVLGGDAADAAKEAAEIQAAAGIAAAEAMKESTAMTVEEQRLAREQAREDLMPFTEFGAGFMDSVTGATADVDRLFTNPTSVMENPMFTALMDDVRRQNLQNAAVGGRLGTGGTEIALQDAALRTGFDILNTERGAALNRANMFTNLVGMGQSAAAGQGAAS
jgi:hypothetical protein